MDYMMSTVEKQHMIINGGRRNPQSAANQSGYFQQSQVQQSQMSRGQVHAAQLSAAQSQYPHASIQYRIGTAASRPQQQAPVPAGHGDVYHGVLTGAVYTQANEQGTNLTQRFPVVVGEYSIPTGPVRSTQGRMGYPSNTPVYSTGDTLSGFGSSQQPEASSHQDSLQALYDIDPTQVREWFKDTALSNQVPLLSVQPQGVTAERQTFGPDHRPTRIVDGSNGNLQQLSMGDPSMYGGITPVNVGDTPGVGHQHTGGLTGYTTQETQGIAVTQPLIGYANAFWDEISRPVAAPVEADPQPVRTEPVPQAEPTKSKRTILTPKTRVAPKQKAPTKVDLLTVPQEALPHNNPGVTLQFGSHQEAINGVLNVEYVWEPPSPDYTIPTTDQERQDYVLRLLVAMKNIVGAKDKEGNVFKNRWVDHDGVPKSFYDQAAMEKVCWDIVDAAEQLHLHGPAIMKKHDHNFAKDMFKSRGLTFEERIQRLVKLLSMFKGRCDTLMKGESLSICVAAPDAIIASSLSNRVANDKRQSYIKDGRKIGKAKTGKTKGEKLEASRFFGHLTPEPTLPTAGPEANFLLVKDDPEDNATDEVLGAQQHPPTPEATSEATEAHNRKVDALVEVTNKSGGIDNGYFSEFSSEDMASISAQMNKLSRQQLAADSSSVNGFAHNPVYAAGNFEGEAAAATEGVYASYGVPHITNASISDASHGAPVTSPESQSQPVTALGTLPVSRKRSRDEGESNESPTTRRR